MNTPLASGASHTDSASFPSQSLYAHTGRDDATGLACTPDGAVRGNLAKVEQQAHLSLDKSKKLSALLLLGTQSTALLLLAIKLELCFKHRNFQYTHTVTALSLITFL